MESELVMELVPNPASNQVLVDVHGLGQSGGTLVMFDLLGKELMVKTLDAGVQHAQFTLSLQGLAMGNYLIKVKTDNEVQTKTLIIVK